MRLVSTTADFSGFCEGKSIAAPLEAFAPTGFKHIDMSFYRIVYKGSPWLAPGDGWKKEVEDCIDIAARCGFDFCQAHAPDGVHYKEGEERDALILATKRSIEACRMLGIPHTVIHGAGCGPDEQLFVKKNIEFYKLFEAEAEKYDVDMLIENSAELWNPDYFMRTGKEMVDFVKAAGIPRMHINWDTGHGNVQGCNQYDEVMAMGSELRALHVQDNYGNADSHVMPMCGTTNYDDLIRGLIDSGYKGDFTFEGGETLRRGKVWPNYRNNVKPEDKLADPPLYLQQKQIAVMYEVGVWFLESYGITVE